MYSRTSEDSTARDRNSSLVLKDLPSVIGMEGFVDVVAGWGISCADKRRSVIFDRTVILCGL